MKIRDFKFYDFIVMFYIIAIFAFENALRSEAFQIIQILFLSTTAFIVLIRKRVIINTFVIWQILFLTIVLIIDLILLFKGETTNYEIYFLFGNSLKLVCIVQYFYSEENINKAILFLIVAGIVASAFIYFDYLSFKEIEYNLKYAGNYRIGADISGGNVNITALNLCFSFSSGIYYLYKESRSFYKQLAFKIVTIFIFGAMMLTGSRKVLIFCLITYLLQAFSKNKNKIKMIYAIGAIAIVYTCLINIDILYFYIGHKIDILGPNDTYSLYSVSDNIRRNLVVEGLNLFFNNPFGIGIGNFKNIMGIYAHNNFIEILVSLGVIGFTVYYSFYLHLLIKLNRALISKELKVFGISNIVGLLIIESFQITYLYKVPIIMLALVCSYVSINKEKCRV